MRDLQAIIPTLAPYRYLKMYDRPRDYAGPDYDGYYPVAGQSRDSSDLELSNFAVMLKSLGGETGEYDPDAPAEDGTGVLIIRDSHWAVGWVETLYVHASLIKACTIADELCGRLEDYPILDEDDYGAREWETACQCWEGMRVADRVALLQRYGGCIFEARRATLPTDDSGAIFDYLRTP